ILALGRIPRRRGRGARASAERRVRLDAGDTRVPRRSGVAVDRAAPGVDRGVVTRVSARIPLRLDRGGHEHREEVRAGWTALTLLGRRLRDSRRGARRAVARVRAGISRAPRRRHGRAQLLRAAAARAHIFDVVARPQLLGKPVRDAPRRALQPPRPRPDPARSWARRRAARPDPQPHHLQRAEQHFGLPATTLVYAASLPQPIYAPPPNRSASS